MNKIIKLLKLKQKFMIYNKIYNSKNIYIIKKSKNKVKYLIN